MITPELATILKEAIENALLDVHVALPGRVQSFNANSKTATIEIMINRLLPDYEGDYISEELPVLQNVRVFQQKSGGFNIYLPVIAGDTGLLIFNEASISQYRATGRKADPEEIGRHTLSSPVFLPGLLTDLEASAQNPPKSNAACLFNALGFISLETTGKVTVNDNLEVLI